MQKSVQFTIHTLWLCMFFTLLGGGISHAACSPGIPCTDYDINSNPTSGTDTTLNGRKTDTNAPHTNTSPNTTSACDGDFMNQIYSRAYMEASREVIMAEQLIHKPDSVLEYTCFDQQAGLIAQHGAKIFSESQHWKDVEIKIWLGGENGGGTNHTDCEGTCPDKDSNDQTINDGSPSGTLLPDQEDDSVFQGNRVDNILTDLLMDSLMDYVDDNFDHNFMGDSITIDNSLSSSAIPTSSLDCPHMGTIWEIARCFDFGEDDRFRSFEHLVTKDPRSIPASCTSTANTSGNTVVSGGGNKIDTTESGNQGIAGGMPSGGLTTRCPPAGTTTISTDLSNDIIRVANNCDDAAGTDLNIYSSFDTMKTYNDLIKGFGVHLGGVADDSASNVVSAGVLDAVACSSPLPTGVPVITYNYSYTTNSDGVDIANRIYLFHYDHVCPNPGCYYQPIKVPYLWGASLPAPSTSGICVPYL